MKLRVLFLILVLGIALALTVVIFNKKADPSSGMSPSITPTEFVSEEFDTGIFNLPEDSGITSPQPGIDCVLGDDFVREGTVNTNTVCVKNLPGAE